MTQAIAARLSLTLLFLIVAFRAPAAAQTASSFEQLALLVESGDRILSGRESRAPTGRGAPVAPEAPVGRLSGSHLSREVADLGSTPSRARPWEYELGITSLVGEEPYLHGVWGTIGTADLGLQIGYGTVGGGVYIVDLGAARRFLPDRTVTPRVIIGAAIHRHEGVLVVAGAGLDVNAGSGIFVRVEPRAYIHPFGAGALLGVFAGGGVRF